MPKLITALFAVRRAAEIAADGLTHHGFTAADIGVMLPRAGRERFEASGVLGAAAAGLEAVDGLLACGPVLAALPLESVSLAEGQLLLGVAAPEEKVEAARQVLRLAGGQNVTVR
jgi:hypothetical protein